MEKDSIKEVCDDLKAKRDCLALAHQTLLKNSDRWNKLIICLSLTVGAIESTKLQLNLQDNGSKLAPIFLSSIISICSALIKFKKFPEQMELLIRSSSIITNTLTKMRNHTELTDELREEYNKALEEVETSLYPDMRNYFIRQSQKNLLEIYKQDIKYQLYIKEINKPEYVPQETDSEVSESPKPKGSMFQRRKRDDDSLETMSIDIPKV
jgi:hypothetical protein